MSHCFSLVRLTLGMETSFVSPNITISARRYLILNDTLYDRGVDSILRRCLTHEEAEIILNEFHAGACGCHLSGLATA